MAEIPTHIAETDQEHDTFNVGLVFRVKVLDAVTGKPLKNAFLTKPAYPDFAIRRIPGYAMRVLYTREAKFRMKNLQNEVVEFSIDTRTLRTFKPASDGSGKLEVTWQCVPEIFRTKPAGKILEDAGGNRFQQINTPDERYVCVESAGTSYCEPIMVTDHDGVLEIPVAVSEWLSGRSVAVALRDYVVVAADGSLTPEAHDRGFAITLEGDPLQNSWKIQFNGESKEFYGMVSYKLSIGNIHTHLLNVASDEKPDLTLWAVRKVKECTSSARTESISRTSTPKGIVLHYNSGYYVNEIRGNGSVLCRNVFESQGDKCCHEDNQYCFDPELCLQILKKLFSSGRTGYHYHIDRSGEVVLVAYENRTVFHAGKSREPATVEAEQEGSDGQALTASHSDESPTEALDYTHIGINLTGHHSDAKYYFTDKQLWYLDRLLENIQRRYSEVKWYSILGHDEVREAYKDAHPSSSADDKNDPGAALKGGMKQLRGRHGAVFSQ